MEMDFFTPVEESRPRNVSPDARAEEEGPWESQRRGKEELKRNDCLLSRSKMKYEQKMAITFAVQLRLLFLSRLVWHASSTANS